MTALLAKYCIVLVLDCCSYTVKPVLRDHCETVSALIVVPTVLKD